jgi:DNA-binding NtrC family response regulator
VIARAHTVLLADADPGTAAAARAALPAEAFQVLEAADARTALATLGSQRVDVLVSELVLPDGSGLHLLVETRHRRPAVARLALTAVEEFDAAVAAVNEAEVFRFLRKPVDGVALRAAIEEAVTRADAAREVHGAWEAAERRRVALVDLESHHPGIALVSLGPEGYFLPSQKVAGLVRRLEGTAVGRVLAEAVAARRRPEST